MNDANIYQAPTLCPASVRQRTWREVQTQERGRCGGVGGSLERTREE